MSEITETELQAYVDNQLDAACRVEVCDYLLTNPDAAERVLLDLRHRDAMLAVASVWRGEPAARLNDAAVSLHRAMSAPRRRRLLKPAAALIAMLLVFEVVGPPMRQSGRAEAAVPAFVEEAIEARQTSILRAEMASQIEAPAFDPKDVRAATRISIPMLPPTWSLRDVQLFPSDYGPSLQVVAEIPGNRRMALFAARARAADIAVSGQTKVGDQDAIYWSRDGNIYVLTGDVSPIDLRTYAQALANNRNA
ncbi:anti-sigma factor family protein [Sphingomonas faeni]|uniref:anti-sigma factor family protein n=1 Tax=Sphingomonas faeni TaxID=185950 RepID=UPI0027866379|nr:anti-sigma factor [Sphingomonas faeni]MDQ0839954.1 anti-sigma factor RsiW [Sphingomonas faeni]